MKHTNIHSAGPISQVLIGNEQVSCTPQKLSEQHVEQLWTIFEQIGENWKDTYNQSKNLRSSWLEMIKVKTESHPSYYAEYINAITVMQELSNIYGEDKAYKQVFFEYQVPTSADNPKEHDLSTLLAHCKHYVINEFIRMQVLAGGFKHFGGESNQNEFNKAIKVKGVNYKGFIKGSRYAHHSLVRTYSPGSEEK